MLLQEVSGKATLRALLAALPDYEAAYVPCRPTYFAVQLFALAGETPRALSPQRAALSRSAAVSTRLQTHI